MDLGAYTNIDSIRELAIKNGIDVPRLRGYRLMKNETPILKEEIDKMVSDVSITIAEGMCRSTAIFSLNSCVHTYCFSTDKLVNRYLIHGYDRWGNYSPIDIRWDLIHGKRRKNLKFEIKKYKRALLKQYDMFNKYCGREDVLYIHSRIGGNNWAYFKGDELVKSQPWYLEHVDDSFDSTYCDIYAKIDINKLNEVMKDGSEEHEKV